jgi:hypothetical protein
MKPDLNDALLMQYKTPLPDNFDLGALHNRIKTIRDTFDHLPGLYFKLYVVNTLELAPIKEYSSIYLWKGLNGMRQYITDSGL